MHEQVETSGGVPQSTDVGHLVTHLGTVATYWGKPCRLPHDGDRDVDDLTVGGVSPDDADTRELRLLGHTSHELASPSHRQTGGGAEPQHDGERLGAHGLDVCDVDGDSLASDVMGR